MSIEERKTYLYATFSIISWSTVATVFKISLKYVSPFELVFLSAITSLTIFTVIMIFRGKFSELKRVNRKDIIFSMLMGLVNPFLYYLILFKGYSVLPAQIAQPLNMSWGIVIALMSIPLLKQKIYPGNIIALTISFFGVILLSTRGNLLSFKIEQPVGIALILASAFIWSLYWLLNARDKKDPVVSMFLNFLFGAFYLLIAAIVLNKFRTIPLSGILGGVYSGIFEMGISYIFWLKAMKSAKNTANISILIYIVPFISLIFISLILKEKIFLSSLLGLVFLITGILLNRLVKVRVNREKKL